MRRVLLDKIYYKNTEMRYFVVYHWSCDLVNNKINILEQNIDEEKRHKKYTCDFEQTFWIGIHHFDFFECENEIYPCASNNWYIRVPGRTRLTKRLKLQISKSINDGTIVYEKDCHRLIIGNDMICMIHDYSVTLFVKENKQIIINESVDIFGKISITTNTDIFYGKKGNELLLYEITNEITEKYIVDMSNYGNIIDMNHLDTKIYMINNDGNTNCALIYDVKTKFLVMDYSFGTECKNIIKYGRNLLINSFFDTSDKIDIYDKTSFKYAIVSLKPNIQSIKTYDICFNFA